jgi:hypothetical protein
MIRILSIDNDIVFVVQRLRFKMSVVTYDSELIYRYLWLHYILLFLIKTPFWKTNEYTSDIKSRFVPDVQRL